LFGGLVHSSWKRLAPFISLAPAFADAENHITDDEHGENE
jgi:hypothetical protein